MLLSTGQKALCTHRDPVVNNTKSFSITHIPVVVPVFLSRAQESRAGWQEGHKQGVVSERQVYTPVQWWRDIVEDRPVARFLAPSITDYIRRAQDKVDGGVVHTIRG